MLKNKALIITVIVLAALIVLFSIASLIALHMSFRKMFSRTEMKPTVYLRYSDVESDYSREVLSFKSGENTLTGYLYGEGGKRGLVVISHGMGGGSESYLGEILYFVESGYTVFGFDNTGCHRSEGDGCKGMSQSLIDLDAALSFIESEARFAELPVYLYGHSWGGYAVAAILGSGHDITASVSVAGYNTPDNIVFEWARDNMGLGALAYLEKPYISLYHRIIFGKYANKSAVSAINSCDTPILLIHGKNDTTVNFGGASIISHRDEITNPNAEFWVCDTENHDDHNKLFMSDAAVVYIDELQTELDELKEKYAGDLPNDVIEEFCASADKKLATELDSGFMQRVTEFYDRAPLRK